MSWVSISKKHSMQASLIKHLLTKAVSHAVPSLLLSDDNDDDDDEDNDEDSQRGERFVFATNRLLRSKDLEESGNSSVCNASLCSKTLQKKQRNAAKRENDAAHHESKRKRVSEQYAGNSLEEGTSSVDVKTNPARQQRRKRRLVHLSFFPSFLPPSLDIATYRCAKALVAVD